MACAQGQAPEVRWRVSCRRMQSVASGSCSRIASSLARVSSVTFRAKRSRGRPAGRGAEGPGLGSTS
eukprot:5263576-Alexandrium_andersonii.AAC.1